MKSKVLSLLGLAVFLLPACGMSGLEEADRPNIIYILVDDMGYGDLGSYGQKHIKTPNLDRMADEGMRFTAHYAGSTVCGPSRATLMTGLHTGHSPIRGNPKWTNSGNPVDLTPEDTTVAKMLQDLQTRWMSQSFQLSGYGLRLGLGKGWMICGAIFFAGITIISHSSSFIVD